MNIFNMINKKILLIGSRALLFHKPDFKLKENADYDFISDYSSDELKVILNLNKIETTTYAFLNNYEFINYISENKFIIINGVKVYPVSLKGLAIIKRSHLYRDYFFDKHITMYHKYLCPKLNDFEYNVDDLKKINDRFELTKKEFDKFGNPNLNQSVKDFFDDSVVKKYDHDYLHVLFAYNDKPLYMSMQTDYNKAWCIKEMWDNFSYSDKCKCVAEETYVIATERFQVNSNWKEPSKLSYMKALKKVCTTLTSGWFRDFAIDNYPEILKLYDHSKFEYVKNQLGETQ